LCDRLAVFRDGRIEQVGTGEAVYESPATRFVAEFVGTSNVIGGDAALPILGSRTTVAIRPERIRIAPAGTSAASGQIAVDGVVAEIVYAGAQTRVVADVPGGARLTAVLLNVTPQATSLTRGDRITLCWDRSAERVLDDESRDLASSP
jgi:putative spermidine/putrescine transport system ATP-binding protein